MTAMTEARCEKAGKDGVAMVAFVLVIAIVGVLVGLGRLKMHEHAVKRRLERTYQIEKLLATRDALTVANTGLKGSSKLAFTNEIPSSNFSDRLVVAVEPVLPVDQQEMTDVKATSGWQVFTNDPAVEITPVTESSTADSDGCLLRFSSPTNVTPYRCAILRRAVRPWFDNEFGYMYILDVGSASMDAEQNTGESDTSQYNLGKLRLYLIGIGDGGEAGSPHWKAEEDGLKTMAKQFDEVLKRRPWIRMELSAVGATKKARRDIAVHDFDSGNELVFQRADVVKMSDEDEVAHQGGFLLSSTAFCGFGETSQRTKLFSPRWDLTRNCRAGFDAHAFTNAFSESVIAIEHVFPTNSVPSNKGIKERSVTVDAFVMREPTTYRIRAYNPKVETEKGRDVVTWIFQTREPDPDAIKEGSLGQQCILDTFGREPASLILERRGGAPE